MEIYITKINFDVIEKKKREKKNCVTFANKYVFRLQALFMCLMLNKIMLCLIFQTFCEALHGYLAEIDDYSENAYLIRKVAYLGGKRANNILKIKSPHTVFCIFLIKYQSHQANGRQTG